MSSHSFPGAPGQPTTPRMLTAGEANVLWRLNAEREWHQEKRQAQAEHARGHEAALLEIAARAEFKKVEADHEALVVRATGLRQALLSRHEPVFDRSYKGLAMVECRVCYVGQDHNMDFPCDDYELARDWEGE